MRLIIVRHGQTDDNLHDILSGQKGPGLNQTGRKQAEKAGLFLRKEKITAAYSSDQLRAKETAKIILRYHPNVPWLKRRKLRDRDFGTYNQKTEAKAIQEAKLKKSTWEDYNFESGESFSDVQRRAVQAYKTIFAKHKNGRVLIVSHGDTIASLLVYLLGKSIYEEKKYSPLNTAITILEISSGKKSDSAKIVLLDSLKHLNGK
ncbi:histidine phosphatase family protein [Candidatus Woesearchaeota archaeon]|nr:histidine phosphatase family protein [Candidatus Woesearchaeota archaeon]